DQAILLPRDDEDALTIVALSWVIFGALCAVMAAVIGLSYGGLPEAWIESLYGDWLYLLPVAVLVGDWFQILVSWSNRCGRLPRFAVVGFTHGCHAGVAPCWRVSGRIHGTGLIWGWLGGRLLGLWMLLRTTLASLNQGM